METNEIQEEIEHAEHPSNRKIGLTMAIVAALLAVATMLGHRAHTEEVLLQTQAADQWAFYQAKNIRHHLYDADARLANLAGATGKTVGEDFAHKSEQQDRDAEEVRKEAQKLEGETRTMTRKGNFYDSAELFLEISIVLSSVALLTGQRSFWYTSFVSTVAGIVLTLIGLVFR